MVAEKVIHDLGMKSGVLPIRAELLEVEDHIDDVMAVEKLVVGVKMVEAYFDLLVFHVQLKMHSDVLHDLALTLKAPLTHSFSVNCYNMEDLMVFDYALRMKVHSGEHVKLERRELDSTKDGKGFVHRAMLYSVKRAVAAVLDP